MTLSDVSSEPRYLRPPTLQDALACLNAEEDALIVAGGVVVGSLINQRLASPAVLVDISRIEDLRFIKPAADGGLAIGALVTHNDVLGSPLVRRQAPLLAEIAEEIACERLRNRGTLGGSLCTVGGLGDPVTGLIALGATLRLRSRDGVREVPAERFYKDAFSTELATTELLESAIVPAMPAGVVVAFGKHGPRGAMDWTQLTIAIVLTVSRDDQVESIRIGTNGVAPTALRAYGTEAALKGQSVNDVDWSKVQSSFQAEIAPPGDLVYSESFKRHLADVLLRRTFVKTVARRARPRSHA